MFTIADSRASFGRRAFLRAGAWSLGGAALGGVSLPELLAGRVAASNVPRLLSGRSVIFVFLHGGPSQLETFDPKMTAPAGVRTTTGEISTSIPGVTFGSSFPKLAQLAHRLAIVRSFNAGNANHDIKPIVSRVTGGASLGAMYARVAGATDATTGFPHTAMLFPRAVDPDAGPGQTQFGRFDSTGKLGSGCAPFMPGSGGDLQQDLRLNVAADRLHDRRLLLSELDRVRWAQDAASAAEPIDRLRQQAFSSMLGNVAGAFDLAGEDPRAVARYDTAPLVRPDQINATWKNYPHYVDNAKSLGKLLLLARRLCEAGCGFVTVTTNFVWDMHADVNNAPVTEGMRYTAPPLDHALSALVEDLHERGLDERVLVVCCGEMGRSPRLNAGGGRDHWGNLAPLVLAGGGLRMGHAIGRSTRDGGAPQSDAVDMSHLTATIMQRLIDPAELRIVRGMPSEVVQPVTAEPIPGLV